MVEAATVESPSPEPPTPDGSRTLTIAARAVAWISLALLLASLTLFRMSNNDIWIHLKTGEYVLTEGWVPHTDPYSFTAADREYIAHEWLAGVVFYLVYEAWGVTGLIVSRAAFIAAACALLIHCCLLLRGRLAVLMPAFACMAYISSARYLTRPHIFSYLMVAAFLWLFFMYRERGRDRRWLYLIPVVHVLWTNLHGGFVSGLALLATFALGETLIHFRARKLETGEANVAPASHLKTLWLLVPGCVLASLINPYGYKILLFPFQLTGMEIFMRSIYEWQPPYHISYNISTMFAFYMVLVFALCASFFVAQRNRERARGGGESLGFVNGTLLALLGLTALAVIIVKLQASGSVTAEDLQRVQERLYFLMGALFFLFSGFTLVNFRTVDFTQAGIFGLFYLMSMRHNRAVTDAAMAMLVVLVAAASAAMDRRRSALAPGPSPGRKKKRPAKDPPPVEAVPAAAGPYRDPSSPLSLVAGSILLLGIAAHVHWDNYYFDFRGGQREKGFGIASNMPVCATDFVKNKGLEGRAFVSYAMAAMLIHKTHPQVKVNMDSRNDVYGQQLYLEFMNALRYPDRMLDYLNRRKIDFMLMGYSDRKPDVFDAVMTTGQWAPVFYDTRGFILVRRTPEHEELIRDEELRYLRPGVMGGTAIDFQNAAQVLLEADRSIRNCPESLFGHYYKSKALQALGRHDEALAANLEVLEFDPDNASVYGDMGYIYGTMGDVDQAIRMYEKSLELEPGNKAVQQNLENLKQSR